MAWLGRRDRGRRLGGHRAGPFALAVLVAIRLDHGRVVERVPLLLVVGLNIVLRARAMPWLTAPAWPVMPPPLVFTNTSSRLSCSVIFSGPRTAARSLSSVK